MKKNIFGFYAQCSLILEGEQNTTKVYCIFSRTIGTPVISYKIIIVILCTQSLANPQQNIMRVDFFQIQSNIGT